MEIPTGWAQINIVFEGLAAPRGAQVVYAAQRVTGGGIDNPQQAADFVRGAWQNEVMPNLVQALTLKEVRVKFGPNATGLDATSTSGQAGGVVQPAEAPQVAALIRKITAQGGRQGKGRMFLPGIPESAVQGGALNTATIDAINAFMLDLLNVHNAVQFPVALLHAEALVSPYIVLAFQTQSIVATQRRRIRKVGGRRNVGP